MTLDAVRTLTPAWHARSTESPQENGKNASLASTDPWTAPWQSSRRVHVSLQPFGKHCQKTTPTPECACTARLLVVLPKNSSLILLIGRCGVAPSESVWVVSLQTGMTEAGELPCSV